tara:strand:- start:60 stop:737 length:678 start_codon:yes stop_codon:yes gene_type:complete
MNIKILIICFIIILNIFGTIFYFLNKYKLDCSKFQHNNIYINKENFEYMRAYKKELFKNVTKLLDDLDIKYVISDGNLLEYYRGDIIVEDDDIDIRVNYKDWDKFEKYNLTYDKVDKKYNLTYDIVDKKWYHIRLNKFKEFQNEKFDIHCDLVSSDLIGTSGCWLNVNYFFDKELNNVKYMGVNTYTPQNGLINKFLKEYYGPNFNKPLCNNSDFNMFILDQISH